MKEMNEEGAKKKKRREEKRREISMQNKLDVKRGVKEENVQKGTGGRGREKKNGKREV